MKYVETTYLANKGILKFPDHYVTISVTVDDTGIVANEDGKKIVPAGTIVGGDVFTTPTNAVKEANTPATADLICAGDNNDITVTAKVFKTLKIALIAPVGNSKPLYVQVVNNTIEVYLATSEAGAIISTAAEVIALLNANPVTSELISATNKGTDTGAAAVTALAAVTLTGGSTYAPEGVLMSDVDVTYGPAGGAMIVHGYIDKAKIPAAPSALAINALKGRILFL